MEIKTKKIKSFDYGKAFMVVGFSGVKKKDELPMQYKRGPHFYLSSNESYTCIYVHPCKSDVESYSVFVDEILIEEKFNKILIQLSEMAAILKEINIQREKDFADWDGEITFAI